MTWVSVQEVSPILAVNHYLGAINRGVAWKDEFGVIVIGRPTARHVPAVWVELVRWCITSVEKNAGSQQWAAFVRALRRANPKVTTIISYSDPSVGHTGALYRACNWWWAPTWLRLRPPPSGNGSWKKGKVQAVKDRWIFPLQEDVDRVKMLTANDESILRRHPWAEYREPGGVPYKKWILQTQLAA